MIGNTPFSYCRPLSAPIWLGSLCCLVLQSSGDGNNLLMDTQANESHKNKSMLDYQDTIMENGKLNMGSLLIECSWQTLCRDTPKYWWWPGIFTLSLSEVFNLEPTPLMPSPFYIPLVLMSYATTHIIDTSPCDALMISCFSWWETHMLVSKCLTRNPSVRAWLSACLCSNYL